MDWARRRAGSLLGFGLVGGLVWATVVGLSMPSWFEPDTSCARKFVGAGDIRGIRTSWFPPSASCVYADQVRPYMSTARSVVLSVLGVLLLVMIVTGLILTVRRLLGDAGPSRTADGVDLRHRRRSHLIFGALDMGVAFVVLWFLSALVFVAGVPGGLVFVVVVLVGLSAFGTLLDRHMGPLPSTARDSRRRGTVAGLASLTVVVAATAGWSYLPYFELWVVLLSALTYAAVVALQWSRVSKANRVRCSG
ncbi:hypothetical protein [Kribbella shirazensis]|uniref:Uncharacterized protein n=1 Tax=Kribbella shirazensis TaxID=1105143 RepID=A0A7X6A1B8_9ACTN|nr:hypothetical protein [Kribbella shirazensis]NIK57004.1 hypothetical protein [Kribbella shirazensis]